MTKKIYMMVDGNEDAREVKACVYDENWKTYEGYTNAARIKKRDTAPMSLYERYFVPDVLGEHLYAVATWMNDKQDKGLLKRELVYKTKEEAIARAKEMLGVE